MLSAGQGREGGNIMPPGTRMLTFLAAPLRRQTEITRALDSLFADPRAVRNNPDSPNLQVDNALDRLQEWTKGPLRSRGLGDQHFMHIDRWPRRLKEDVRKALVRAIDPNANRPVVFFWELYDGADPNDDEQTVIDETVTPVRITFRTPIRRVRA